MTVSVSTQGIEIELFGGAFCLFLGELYLRVPQIGEIAWNSTGFYMNRLPLS